MMATMLSAGAGVAAVVCGLALTAPAELTLQEAVTRSMAAGTGAVVVADVSTGQLLAHHRSEVAATRLAAPGSAVKPLVLLALLEAGKLGAQDQRACPRQLRLAGRSLDCSHPPVGFPLDPVTALAYSCNNYFAHMALRLTPAELAEALRRVGRVRVAASAEELQLQALGEAGIEVTPLGLLNAYRRLARLRAQGRIRLSPLFEGLEAATEYGTGQLARLEGLKVAGKTGSSASGHAWFAGWAPADHPAIVLVVFLEQGRGGAGAAPVARAIFEAYARAKTGAGPRARQVTVRIEQQTLRLPLEEYVAAVLAGECATFTSEEALQAMAVTARTWAARHRGRHRAEGFDFCDTTHCQYLRLDGRSARLRAAVEATEGELLWYQGAPAAAFHHGHCGGMTEAAADVWPEMRAPYLRAQSDTYCTATGRANWSSEVGKDDLRRALGLGGPVALEILRRLPSGRVAEVRLGGRRWPAPQFESAVGRALGWHVLRSSWYEVSQADDRLVFRGHGAGHGVGLCQTGAARRGEQGQTYRQILAFYFPGTALGLSAQGFAWTRMQGERVEVWSTHPQQEEALVALADRALAEAERRSGWQAKARPRLMVYPTVAAFRDATGEPGWVAASTLGRTMRMQPSRLLGDKLKGTLLHEMLHVVVEERAHPKLPPWFREGLVVFLAEGAEGAEGRVGALVERYGRKAVLSWLEQGLPPGVR